jgi:hypothetical protein
MSFRRKDVASCRLWLHLQETSHGVGESGANFGAESLGERRLQAERKAPTTAKNNEIPAIGIQLTKRTG